MTEAEAAAQEELRQIGEELDEICSRLAAVNERLPVSPQETAMLLGEEEMDISTQVRSVIECVLVDKLWPSSRALAAAASYRPSGRTPHPREDATPVDGVRLPRKDLSKS